MFTILRRVAALAAPLVIAGSLTSCGLLGLGGPPTDADQEEFCEAHNAPYEEFFSSAAAGEPPDGQKIYDVLQTQIDDLEGIGTPEDISEEEREGFEIYLEEVGAIDEDEFVEAFESDPGSMREEFGGKLAQDDEDKVAAYNTYATETCGDPLEEPGGQAP